MQDIAHQLLEPLAGAVTVDAAGKVEVPRPHALAAPPPTSLPGTRCSATRRSARRPGGCCGRSVRSWACGPPPFRTSTWRAAAARFTASPSRPSTSAASPTTRPARCSAQRGTSRPGPSSSRSRAPRWRTPTSAPPSTCRCCWRRPLREGFRGPLFVQGDHFQINAKKYASDPEGEVGAVKALIARRWRPASTTSTSTPRRWWTSRSPRSTRSSA